MKPALSSKTSCLLYGAVVAALAAVAALNFSPRASAASGADKNAPASATGDDQVFDPNPYDVSHYDKLLGKSPFDFDAPPAEPPPAVRPMEGWAQAGISITTDYMSVTLINLKNPNDKVRLTKYLKPEDQELNNRQPRKKSSSATAGPMGGGGKGFGSKGRGQGGKMGMPGGPVAMPGQGGGAPQGASTFDSSDLKLVDIEFEQGKPRTYRNATAVVTKAGVVDRVAYDEQVAQMKPQAQPININNLMNRGGANPIPNQPGGVGNPNPTLPLPMAQPGNQGQPQGNNTNAALMQLLQSRNSAAAQGQPGQPTANLTPPPTVTNNPASTPAPPPQLNLPTQTQGQGQQPPSRRRVVLPNNEPGNP